MLAILGYAVSRVCLAVMCSLGPPSLSGIVLRVEVVGL